MRSMPSAEAPDASGVSGGRLAQETEDPLETLGADLETFQGILSRYEVFLTRLRRSRAP